MSILYVQKLTLLIVCNLFFITCVTAQKPELQKSYYPNGNIKSTGYSKDGYKEGVWKEYFETGEISSVYHYQEGRIHGDIKTYFKNGQVYVSRTFSNGFRVGEHKWYHDNGKLQTVGHYSNDVQVGEWKRYDENGTLDNTEMFYNINREAAISDLELRGVSTYTKNGVKETRVDLKNLKSNIGARIHPPGHSSAFYLKDDRGKRYELIGQESWPGDGPNGFGRTGKSVLNLVVSLKFEYVPIDQVKRLDLVEGDCKSGCWHLYNILSTNRTISYDSDMCMSGDCTNGEGLYKWSNGDTYEGTFKYGKPEGQGVYNLANGDKYEGEFKNGKEEGKGIIYLANGDKIEGSFENNLIRYGTFYGSNGETYSGSWSDGLPGGSGTYTFSNGEKYDGQFAKGKYSGYGTFHYKDGSQYNGLYQNGSIHGDGVYYPKSGEM